VLTSPLPPSLPLSLQLKFSGKELENLKAAAMLPLVKAKAGDDIW